MYVAVIHMQFAIFMYASFQPCPKFFQNAIIMYPLEIIENIAVMVLRKCISSLNHLSKEGNLTTNLAEGYFPIDTQERLRFLAIVYNVEMVFRFSAELLPFVVNGISETSDVAVNMCIQL